MILPDDYQGNLLCLDSEKAGKSCQVMKDYVLLKQKNSFVISVHLSNIDVRTLPTLMSFNSR